MPDTVRTLVAALAPTPAFVLAPWGDVLVANEPWEALAEALGLAGDPPNLARFTFLDPRGVPPSPTGTRWPTSRSTSCARPTSAGAAIR